MRPRDTASVTLRFVPVRARFSCWRPRNYNNNCWSLFFSLPLLLFVLRLSRAPPDDIIITLFRFRKIFFYFY